MMYRLSARPSPDSASAPSGLRGSSSRVPRPSLRIELEIRYVLLRQCLDQGHLATCEVPIVFDGQKDVSGATAVGDENRPLAGRLLGIADAPSLCLGYLGPRRRLLGVALPERRCWRAMQGEVLEIDVDES